MREPTHIGKFEVLDVLGRGAFGVVYRCSDTLLDRIVAIKVLLAANHSSQEVLDRFAREARTAAKLSHPHIVQVYDVGTDGGGHPYLVMEFVDGQGLDQLIKNSPWDLLPALQLTFHLADALAYSHENKIIHRDIKPANIIVDKRGRPKLTDFGLARLTDEARWLSSTGDLLGTPRYMSPEQALLPSEEIDHRTDIYSLGTVLYELLTCRPLVDGPTPLATLKDLTDGRPKPLVELRPDLPKACIDICERMIAKNRNDRFSSTNELTQALKELIIQTALRNPEIASLARIDFMSDRLAAESSRKEIALIKALPSRPLVAETSPSFGNGLSNDRWRLVRWSVAGLAVLFSAAAFLAYRFRPGGSRSDLIVRDDREGQNSPIEWGRRIEALSATRDDRQYHANWNELREELNSAIRRRPNEASLRLLRAPLLARNGDFLEANEDWSLLENDQMTSSVHRMRLHALAVWELLFVGNIVEETLIPQVGANIRSLIELCEGTPPDHPESLRNQALAKWIRFVIEDEIFSFEMIESLPRLPKQDLAFADVQTWKSFALLRYADQLHYTAEQLPEEQRESQKRQRDHWEQQAMQAMREGLEADSHHLGLLFLRAFRVTRRFDWDSSDGLSWPEAERKYRSTFDSAFQRFRSSPSRLGFETSLARAVLLDNIGRNAPALDQINEVVDRSGVPAIVVTLWAWLMLNQPPEESIDTAFSTYIRKTVESANEGSVPLFGNYFIQALCYASQGKWNEARSEILQGKKVCNIESWDEISGRFGDWLSASEEPQIVFRDRTVEAIWRIPAPPWIRQEMQEEVLRDLDVNHAKWSQELSAERIQQLLTAGYFRMAKFFAEQDDRDRVLLYVRQSLEQKSAEVTVSDFQQDELIRAWNNDEEFVNLYREYSDDGEPE